MTQRHIIVKGRVQGVFFRATTKEKAEQMNLTGWVRNRSDGSVETVIQGSETAVKAMLDWLKTGPPKANVTQILVTIPESLPLFSEFTIRHD